MKKKIMMVATCIAISANALADDFIQYRPAFVVSGQITSKNSGETKPICPFSIVISEGEKKTARCNPLFSSVDYQADFWLTKTDIDGQYILTQQTEIIDTGNQVSGFAFEKYRGMKTLEKRIEKFTISSLEK